MLLLRIGQNRSDLLHGSAIVHFYLSQHRARLSPEGFVPDTVVAVEIGPGPERPNLPPNLYHLLDEWSILPVQGGVDLGQPRDLVRAEIEIAPKPQKGLDGTGVSVPGPVLAIRVRT